MSPSPEHTVERVRQVYHAAVVRRCAEQSCALLLSELPPHVALKGERLEAREPVCDCLVFVSNRPLIVALVELRSQTIHADHVVRKLSRGTEVAGKIMEVAGEAGYDLYHFVLAKRWPRSEYTVVTMRSIQHQGRPYRVMPNRCGSRLRDLLKYSGVALR